MREGGCDGVEVPHVVVVRLIGSCLVIGVGCLVDQPDFNGIINKAILVIGNADGDGCGFIDGEVSWVSIYFTI
jgi:hypothetical protein